MSMIRFLSMTGITAALLLGAVGCSRVGYSNQVSQPALSCDQVSSSVIQQERSGEIGVTIDHDIQYLSDNCPEAYEITIDYVSSRAMISPDQIEPCADWNSRIRSEAVELLRADGLCGDAPASSQGSITGGLSWDSAASYVGTEQRVCGPLITTRFDNDDVFLNLGRDYPDSSRFTIVIWDVGGVEQLPPGTEVCATGTVSSYNGVAQIELYDVGAVEVWD